MTGSGDGGLIPTYLFGETKIWKSLKKSKMESLRLLDMNQVSLLYVLEKIKLLGGRYLLYGIAKSSLLLMERNY